MNSVLTLEESFGKYLKQQMEHSMYEFTNYYTLISDMKENIMEEINWKNIHMRKGATDYNTNNT